jgi:hypothetical protein
LAKFNLQVKVDISLISFGRIRAALPPRIAAKPIDPGFSASYRKNTQPSELHQKNTQLQQDCSRQPRAHHHHS